MRSRRSSSGWLLGDTKAYGREVTSKASFWPTWKEGQAAPRRRPQPFSRILTAWKGFSPKFASRISHISASIAPGLPSSIGVRVYMFWCWIDMQDIGPL
jgi:hypothetical protein